MIGTEPLKEPFVAAENGFSSGEWITDWQEESVSLTKDILCVIQKDIGANLIQLVRVAETRYNKSPLDRRDLYCNITNKSKGVGKN